MILDPNRHVGYESRKSYEKRCQHLFWDKWITGPVVLDIGFRGGEPSAMTIVPGAIGFEANGQITIDVNTPMHVQKDLWAPYDGFHLPFKNDTVDTIHASHVLEHLYGARLFFQEWFRVLRVGGTLIIFVPHAYLYERRMTVPPSRWSPEHLVALTPSSLLAFVEASLEPNSYRVEHLAVNDDGYDYSLPIDVHPQGCFEIELVIRKTTMPAWRVEP
jgi:SAM-dependent methyltransferase